jgi:hypothetical protein
VLGPNTLMKTCHETGVEMICLVCYQALVDHTKQLLDDLPRMLKICTKQLLDDLPRMLKICTKQDEHRSSELYVYIYIYEQV